MLKRCLIAFILSYFIITPLMASAKQIVAPHSAAIVAQSIDRIVAIVNDDVITASQLDHQVALAKQQLQNANVKMPTANVFRRNILQRMIDLRLQLQLAKKSNITVSNSDLTKAIQSIANQNHMTLQQLYDSVQQHGLSVKTFRKQIHDEVLVQKLQGQMVASRISISEQEVNDYLQANKGGLMPQYHLQNILIALPATPSTAQVDAAKAKAEKVIQQLKQGKDFKQLAAAESRGSAALQGGDLGWRKMAELPEVFAAQVKHMKTGDLAGPIQTPNGFHIIKLLGVKGLSRGATAEQAEIQMIYLRKNKNDSQRLVTELNRIRTRAQRGTDFGSLAKKYSQDPSVAHSGYLGWTNLTKLPAAVSSAVLKMQSGSITKPIVTSEGVYLVKVIAKRNIVPTTAARRREVQQLIFRRKLEENIQTFINNLRSQAYIKTLV